MIVNAKYKIYKQQFCSRPMLWVDIKYKINNDTKKYKISGDLQDYLFYFNMTNGTYCFNIGLSNKEISTLNNFIKENGIKSILKYFINKDIAHRKIKTQEKEDISFILNQKSDWVDIELGDE